MNVHIGYKVRKTPDIEKEVHQQVEKLRKRLQAFRPELVHLKALIEDAAAGGGLSVNAWIVRAAAAGLASEGRRAPRPAPAQKPDRIGQSYSGWVR